MPLAATQMDLEIVILSEVSQSEKEKYHMISNIHIYQMWDLKKMIQVNLFTKQKHIHRLRQ